MSLDVYLNKVKPVAVFTSNCTHNLGAMAKHYDLYLPLWRPEDLNVKKALELIPFLAVGLTKLLADPEGASKYNPENGWGDYKVLCDFVKGYLMACIENPDADVEVSR